MCPYLFVPHVCEVPQNDRKPICTIWQCDTCKQLWMKSLFIGYSRAYQDETGVYRYDSEDNRKTYPPVNTASDE